MDLLCFENKWADYGGQDSQNVVQVSTTADLLIILTVFIEEDFNNYVALKLSIVCACAKKVCRLSFCSNVFVDCSCWVYNVDLFSEGQFLQGYNKEGGCL